jgi:hypothetical protein
MALGAKKRGAVVTVKRRHYRNQTDKPNDCSRTQALNVSKGRSRTTP